MLIAVGVLTLAHLFPSGQGMGMAPPPTKLLSEDILSQNVVSYEVQQVEFQEAIKQLFADRKIKYDIGPAIKGSITLTMRNAPLGKVFEAILQQVACVYRVADDTVLIRAKLIEMNPFWASNPGPNRPDFVPGDYTSQYDFRDSSIFKSPLGTIGGTFDLLLEAVRVAGYRQWSIWSYGKTGFAIVLPFEHIKADGSPGNARTRFKYHPKYLANCDFRKINDYVGTEFEALTAPMRIIVLTATADQGEVKKEQIARNWVNNDDPLSIRKEMRTEKWGPNLKVSAMVYQFKAGTERISAQLLLKDAGLPARTHLIKVGLWPESLLN